MIIYLINLFMMISNLSMHQKTKVIRVIKTAVKGGFFGILIHGMRLIGKYLF